MPRRLYFEDSPDGPRIVLRRSNTTGTRISHHDKKRNHHLADDVVDHFKDHMPRLHRPWSHNHSEDEVFDSRRCHHQHHRSKSGELVISWEEWKSLVERERTYRKQTVQLQEDVDIIKSQLEDQKVASAALARDNNALAATIRKFQDANQEFAKENEILRNQLAAERGRHCYDEHHHRELRALQREVERLREERGGFLDRITHLKEDLQNIGSSRVEKLLIEVGILKRDCKDAIHEKNEWRDRYEKQVSQQNALRDRTHELQCRISKLQEEVDRCRRRHAHIY